MEDIVTIKFKKLDERAVIPSYAHDGDIGMDFTAIDIEYDAEKDLYICHTGLATQSDFNVGEFIFPRSSNTKTEAYLPNSVGVVDSVIYRGEIQFRYRLRDSINSMINQEVIYQMALMGKDFTFDMYEEIAKKVKQDAKELKFSPYKVGDRIGQLVVLRHPTVQIEEVTELSETVRGEGGFGSSGN